MLLKRHYLLELSDKGRLFAKQNVQQIVGNDPEEMLTKMFHEGYDEYKIPAIVRREENEYKPGTIPVGFSSPQKYDGQRIRIAAFVPKEEIVGIITPYKVANMSFSQRTPCLQALVEAKKLAIMFGLKLGVWGSTALEIFTGLPYTNINSDLDILVKTNSYASLLDFYEYLLKAEHKYGCKIDLEVDLITGFGIKAAELFQSTDTVLGKSLRDVRLLDKIDVQKLLNHIDE